MNTPQKFKLGDIVRKTKGSQWSGTVVSTYSTALTPEGYAVESSTEKGSVQIYPAAALERVDAATESLQAEVERLRKASVPVCVGRPLIQILAAEGQWVSEDGQGLIAADCLFRKDPYIELEKLRGQVEAVEGLRAAALEHLECYVRLVNSGDCGNWNPEKEESVIALRIALSKCSEIEKNHLWKLKACSPTGSSAKTLSAGLL